jgi:1,4-dihydroxy-2-naphthoate octaprenyltransferase
MVFFVLFGVRNFGNYICHSLTVGNTAYGYKVLVMYLCLYSSVGKYFRCEFYTQTIGFQLVLPAIAIGLLSVGVLNLNMREKHPIENQIKIRS